MFVKTYLDENISHLVAEILRSRGYEVLTAQEAGNKGLSDDKQLDFACNIKMAILTHDRVDFENLAKEYFSADKTHFGIIIVFPHPPQEIAQRLNLILNNFTADEMKNQIIYI
jgi:predicted nuclease of predicted toxin-antitoxin system